MDIPNVENKCSFCKYMVEMLEHLLIQCVHVTNDLQLDLKTHFGKEILLKHHDLLLIFNIPNSQLIK